MRQGYEQVGDVGAFVAKWGHATGRAAAHPYQARAYGSGRALLPQGRERARGCWDK